MSPAPFCSPFAASRLRAITFLDMSAEEDAAEREESAQALSAEAIRNRMAVDAQTYVIPTLLNNVTGWENKSLPTCCP